MNEDLIYRLKDLLETEGDAAIQRERDGYLGRWTTERLNLAREAFLSALNDHIDARIEAARHQVKEEKA